MNTCLGRGIWLRIFLIWGLVVGGVQTTVAAVPDTINYQGFLTDSAGTPLEGSQLVNFYLYDHATTGSLVWNEQQTITLSSGIFNLQLGADMPLDIADFGGGDLYLEIEIFASGSGWEILTPRQKLTSTGFAMQSGNTDTLDGHPAADFSPAGHDHDGLYVNEGQGESITTFMIANGTITASDLAAGSVGSSAIADNSITTADLADDSVTAGKIATAAVGVSEIAASAVGTSEIIDNSVTAADLAAGSVGTSEVADNSLTASDLGSNSVTADEIAKEAVGSSEIADGAVTAADLADDYVNTSGDTMTGDLNLNADLNVSGSSMSSSDYMVTFESSGGDYAYAIKGIANSDNYSARGLMLDVDSPNSVGYGIVMDVDAPGGEAFGLDLSVSCLGTNCIGVDSGAYSAEGFAQGIRINATSGIDSNDGTLGINANVSNYGTGYLHGLDIDADHYGTSGAVNGIYVSLYGSDNGDAKGVYVDSNKYSDDIGGSVYGGHFIGDNNSNYGNGYGVLADAQCTNATCYGLYGKAVQSSNYDYNYGLYGEGASSSSRSYGVYGSCNQTSTSADIGYGGYFYASSDTTFDGPLYGSRSYIYHLGPSGNSYGLSTYVLPSDTGNAYGIYSSVSPSYTSGDAWAGVFYGDVDIYGTLSKSGGSFKIDHPLDPENKYLQHSFVESPDMMNVYNGNVMLDENGEALVELPDYFEALNRDFRYQLTCIGGFAPVYIAEKIKENTFRIAGGAPDMEVSWQVTGVRQDAWAEANPIEVEVDKDETEKGTYIYPELYGKDMKSGVAYARDPEMMEEMLKASREK
ncbi:MAG: hypothetical protein KQH63_02245 [Desulfobulbaceae bacterium]|nr:hypothetical protein [Desulfobulbaceae bacterium]